MATEIENLTEAVNDLSRQIRRGGTGATPSGGSSWSPLNNLSSGLDNAANASGTATDALGKLASGTATAKDAIGLFTNALKDYGGSFGKIIGNIAGKFSEAMIDTNNNLKKASEYGANFNNDIAEFDYLIKGARMTQEEYTEMVKKGAQELSGLGSSVNSAQKNFLKMAEAYQSSPVISQLEKLGMSAEEANKALYISSQGRGGVNGSDPGYQRMQIEAAERLILAVDENTRITGIGRKEALEELQKKKDDRKLKLARSFMSQEQITALDSALAKMQGMGPGFKRLFEEVMTGGIRTLEGRQAAAALGPAAVDVIKAANLYNKGDTGAGEAMLQKAMGTAIQVQQDPNMRKAAMYGGSAVTDKMAEEFAQAESYRNKVLSKLAEEGKTGKLSNEDYQTALGEVIADAQKGQNLGQEGGDQPTGAAKAAMTINEIDRTLKGMAAGLSAEFGKLANAAGESASSVKMFGMSLDEILAQRSQKDWTKFIEASGLTDAAKKELLDHFPTKLSDAYSKGKPTSENKTSEEDITKPIKPLNEDGRASGSPTFEKFLNGNGGFKDMFEEFDPKGTPMELHGRELVATEDQMKRFMEKMFPEDMVKQITNHAKAAISQAEANAMPASISMPIPTSFGSEIAEQLKPNYPQKATATVATTVSPSNNLEKVDEVFKNVTNELTVVTNRLSDVADKLKGVNFNTAGDKLSEQIQEAFKNIDPDHLLHKDYGKKNVDKADYEAKTAEERKADEEKKKKEEQDRNKPIVEGIPAKETAVVKEEPKKENPTVELKQPQTIEEKEAADKKAKFDAETKDYNGYVSFLKDKLEELKFHHHNAFYDADKERYQGELDKMIAQGAPKNPFTESKVKESKIEAPKPVIEPKVEPAVPVLEPKSTTLPTKPAKEEFAKEFPVPVDNSEAELRDPYNDWTNAEMQELETGELSAETIKQQDRESKLTYYINKIAELKGRNDPDAKHDLPIVQAEFEKFKPIAEAEAAKERKQREETLARENAERNKAQIKNTENTRTYDTIDHAWLTTAPPSNEVDSNEIGDRQYYSKKPLEHPLLSGDLKLFDGFDKSLRDEYFKSKDNERTVPKYELSESTPEAKTEPGLHSSFTSLSDKLAESMSTNISKPVDNTDKITSAMETFKSPDYSASFSSIDNKLSSADLLKEYTQQESDNGNEARLQDERERLVEQLKESGFNQYDTDVNASEEQYAGVSQQDNSPGFFDKVADIFKDHSKPLFTSGNVKYENVEQESTADHAERMRQLNSPEAIAARKADENSALNQEIYRQKHSGMYKNNPNLHENIKQPEAISNQPTEGKPATKHIGGLETWQEFNSRLNAEEVAKSHAQIKDFSPYKSIPSTEELKHASTPPKAEESLPIQPPEPVAQTTSNTSHSVTLKEIYDAVLQLNKTMTQMAHNTEVMQANSSKQIRATKGLSDNRWA